MLLLLIIEELTRLGHFDSNLDPLRSLYDIRAGNRPAGPSQ